MRNKLLVLIIALVLLSGIALAQNAKILGEGDVDIIQKTTDTFDPFWLILISVILVLILVFILIIIFASRIEGSNKPIKIGAAIGFLVGLLGFVTYGITAFPILYLLSFFGIFLSLFGVESLVVGLAMAIFLSPFIYAIIGTLIGIIIKIKIKNKND